MLPEKDGVTNSKAAVPEASPLCILRNRAKRGRFAYYRFCGRLLASVRSAR
jgi:hypothetical protein